MRRFTHRWQSLRNRVMVGLCAAVVIVVLSTVVVVLRFVYQTERNAWQSRQREAAQGAARTVEVFIDQVQDSMALVGLLDADYLKANTQVLLDILYQNPELLEIIRLDRDGNVLVGAYQDQQPVLTHFFTIAQSTWFVQAREGQRYVSDVQLSALNEPYVILSTPAADGSVVAARLRMDVLLDVVLDLRFGETGRAYIVDRRGYVVAYPEEVTMSDATIASRPETRAAIQAVEGGWSGTYLNFEGQQVLGIALPISDTGWTILTEVAESEATAATRQASIVLGGGVLFFGLVVLLVTNYLMLNLVLRPVEELRDGAERVGRGDLDCRLDSQRPDEIGQVAAAFNEMAARLQQRETALAETQERLRDALGRYVAPQLADEVMAHGASLGGETVSASVLFADIRGFTTLSEKLSPKLVVDLLNRYFAAVEPVIAAEGGWIAKFGGDSLLAVFGAPAPQADHARRAVRAALRIRDALEEFNREQRRHEGPTLRVGIGITCGEMVAGSVGSPQRMEYTVVGDIVNTASRIDDLNKTWSTDLLVSAAVYEQVAPYVSARPMPPIEVEGKSEVMQLYAIAVEAMHIMIPLIDV